MKLRQLQRDEAIVREHDQPSRSCLVIEGFAYRFKAASDGKRQIFSFQVRGEIPDLHSLHLKTMDHDLAALSPAIVGFIAHSDLLELCVQFPGVAGTLWRETLIDGSIFREWMLGIGQRQAQTRIAHLFCELYLRLDAVGLAQDWTVSLPITQEQLGDALGLSTVHVNRSLNGLRADSLITLGAGKLRIDDWDGLKDVADFDPAYLHLRQPKPSLHA
jgi:CRP-like cAMP-binding protein